MVLAVFGDIEESYVIRKVNSSFADFKKGEKIKLDLKKESRILKNRKTLKYLERMQAVIYIGFHGIKATDEERYAFLF